MRAERKNIRIHDGIVTDILRGSSVQVEIENRYYDAKGSKQMVTEPVTLRLDNPAQAEGLEKGTKVAIFRDEAGRTNLVRDGQWKSGGKVMVASKKDPSKEYDHGSTVIMGKCTSVSMRTPEGKQPYLLVNVITDDHTQHHISIYDRPNSFDDKAIEQAQERFKDFIANDKHGFIPFTGTFVTQNCSREGEHEYNGNTYVDRNYFGLTVLGSYQDYTKVEEKQYAKSQTQEKEGEGENDQQQAEQPSTSQDMNAGLDDGFVPQGDYDEELPFD